MDLENGTVRDKMKSCRGIIFDLDGTLVNTLEDLADSVNEALEKMGFPVWQTDDYRLKVGRGFRNLMENSVPEEFREDAGVIGQMLEYFVAAYDRRYLDKSRPYEGIGELLDELAAGGIFLAVNSNKRTDYAERLVAKLFPQVPFVGVFGEREGVPKKPDPAGALELCARMGLEPGEVIYAGDSNTDIQTGKNAGMETIGVSWGFRGAEELRRSGASYIAEKPSDISGIIFREN